MQKRKISKYIWIIKIINLYLAIFMYRKVFINIIYRIDIKPNNILITGIMKTLEVVLSVVILNLLIHNKPKLNFGRVNKGLKQMLMGISIGIISFIVIFVVFIATGVARISNFNEISTTGVGLAIGIYLFVGVTEEIFSRAVVGSILKESNSLFVVYLVSSMLFSGIHLRNTGIGIVPLINLIFAGLIMIDMYIRTGNLWMSIGFHFSWNFIQSFLGFSVSGTGNSGSILTLLFTGNTLITGGAFGAEGSIIASIILLLTICIMSKINISSINQ